MGPQPDRAARRQGTVAVTPPRAAGRQNRKPAPRATATGDAGRADAPGLAARKAATRLLAAVIDARTPLDGLTDNEHGHPQYMALEPRDRALVRAILAAALRHRNTIAALIAARLDRPLPANATALSHILHVAAAQMLFLDIPDSAAVDLAVTQAHGDPRTVRFAALVNAVLREIGRRKERALPAALAGSVEAPEWLAAMLETAYGPERARHILDIQRSEAPFDFSVKEDVAGWAERLGGIAIAPATVRLEKLPAAVPELPGFDEGGWWVQDFSASLPARLMGEVAGKRVLDMCAAPGGKTAQMILAGGKVTAVEKSQSRARRLAGNLERLKLEAEIVIADALDYRPGAPFDAILVDAPCSSTGTIRRHPDVAWTKTPDDVAKLAALQRRMLDHAATLLAPGGTLVFANCSLDPSEGEDMVRSFLADRPEFAIAPAHADQIGGHEELIAPEGWLRTTPADLPAPDGNAALSGCDGFFAVRLRHAG